MSRAPAARLTAAAGLWAIAVLVGSGQTPIAPSALRNHPAVQYQSGTPRDPVARLNARLRGGETTQRTLFVMPLHLIEAACLDKLMADVRVKEIYHSDGLRRVDDLE